MSVKFSDVPVMGYFFDFDDDLCQKVSDTQAITPCCAKGWTAGFCLDEQVWCRGTSNDGIVLLNHSVKPMRALQCNF